MASTISVVFAADTRQLDGAFKKVTGQTETFGSKVKGVVGKAGALLAGGALVRGFADVTQSAIDYQDKLSGAASQMGVTFERLDAQAKDLEFIPPSVAAKAQQSLGVVTKLLGQSGEEAFNTSGSLLKVAESMSVVTGTDAEAIIDGISGAFRGEYDSLQQVIPSINAAAVQQKALEMTGKDAASALTEQEKAQAALNIITESGAGFIEQLGANTGTAAAKQRAMRDNVEEAKLKIGEMGATLANAVLPTLGRFADVLASVPGPVLAIAGALAGGVGLLWAFNSVAAAAKKAVIPAFNLIMAHPIVAGIAAIIAVGVLLVKNWDTVKAVGSAVWNFLSDLIGDVMGSIRSAVVTGVQFVVDKFLWFAETIVGAAAKAFGWVPGIGPKLEEARDKISTFRDTTNAALDAIKDRDIRVTIHPTLGKVNYGALDNAIGNVFGDGPGGPMAPRGGSALARVKAILPDYPGLRITSTYRSPARNRAAGGSPTSYHLDRNNPAVDVGGPTYQLDRFHAALGGGWREKLWRTKGHWDHVHVAHQGGMVESSWPTLRGLGADERPAILQVGEQVIAKGGASPTVVVHVAGSVVSERDLARTIEGVMTGRAYRRGAA